MLNPDTIPLEWGIPVAFILYAVLFFLWLRDHLALKTALRQRPGLKLYNSQTNTWDNVVSNDELKYATGDHTATWDDIAFEAPRDRPLTRKDFYPRYKKPANNFYDHEQETAG